MKKIALVGNPNSGKTTLFNLVTGLNQTVGNWTGVTIEKKEGRYLENKDIYIIDLPGVYSMTSYTLEEKITRNYIENEKPDMIINVVDATNLERNLYLTTQLLECGTSMIVALNMEDELKKNGIKIDVPALEKKLGVSVISISALKNRNIDKLMNYAAGDNIKSSPEYIRYDNYTENTLSDIKELLGSDISRFTAVKLLEKDEVYMEKFNNKKEKFKRIIQTFEKEKGESSTEYISDFRYNYIENLIRYILVKNISKAQKITDRIDAVITNRYLAFPIFAVVIFVMYYISVTWFGSITSDYLEDLLIVKLGNSVQNFLKSTGASEWLISLTVNGVIKGVGTVLTYIPQILVLFLIISILEGCGYMARVAYIMDRIFKKIGLSGKSFIPMIIGCGCSVPAIMATRTIENNDERRLTILLTPFIPCSAKLPVFALFAGAFFPDNPFAAPSMYILGIAMVIISGLILKKFKIFKSSSETFILELPKYRVPRLNNVMIQLYEKAKSFLIKAGTIIFVSSIVLWFLQSFNWRLRMAETEGSILAGIGKMIAPIFIPAGFGNWKAAVSIFTGFFAKEAVVSTLSILLGNAGNIQDINGQLMTVFTPLTAYAFMAFILLAPPCVAALGAARKELGSGKWLLLSMGFQFALGYSVAMIIYLIGSLYNLNKGVFITVAVLICFAIISLMSIKYIKKNKGGCAGNCSSCALSGKYCIK